ncbi:MAG: chloride channel protein [Deltaproteobacteria bacterium]|nr:chloride channel protein [Deltaproteobacteria bacterium]
MPKNFTSIFRHIIPSALTSGRFAIAGKFLFYYVLIGVIAGLGSVAFHYLCQVGFHFFMDYLAGYRPPSPAGEGHLLPPTSTPFNRWLLLFLPAIGGVFSGWLVYTFAPEAEGHGTDAAIDAYHNKGGFVRARIPIIKTIASALTITSGGSGGREGPIAQIGAGFGSFLATVMNSPERERRIMLAAGMGAGIGSIFRAPLAGALFAAEVLYKDPEFEAEVIIPAGISSVVAYCVFCLFFGWGSLFNSQDFVFQNPLELGPYTVLSFVLVGAGILYVKSFYGIHGLFKKIPIPNHIKPAIGGLITGIIGFFLPQTLAFGYGYAQMALDNQLPTLFLLGLALGKIFTTSFSIGSGGSGGVFGPSVVIGGALGGAVGRVFNYLLPNIVTHPGAFVVVGMAGFFAAVSNAPISTIIFVSEMTNSYHLLLPSMFVCSLAYLVSRRWTIYIKQVQNRVASHAHRGEFFVDVLAAMKVNDLLAHLKPVQLIPEEMTFNQFREIFASGEQQYFPVVDRDGNFTFDEEIGNLVLMKDIANSDIIYLKPSDDLNEALRKFTIRNLNQIPVVKEDNPHQLLGMLDRREVIQAYNERIKEIKAGMVAEEQRRPLSELAHLQTLLVKNAMNTNVETVSEDMSLEDLKNFIFEKKFNIFPVVNSTGQLIGIISLSDVVSAMQRDFSPETKAKDIATKNVVTVTENDTLLTALKTISTGDYAMLPVTDGRDSRTLLGVISRRDIMSSLGKSVLFR